MKQRGRSICFIFETKGTHLFVNFSLHLGTLLKCKKTLTKRSVPKCKKIILLLTDFTKHGIILAERGRLVQKIAFYINRNIAIIFKF